MKTNRAIYLITCALALVAMSVSCKEAKNTVEDWWHMDFYAVEARDVECTLFRRGVAESYPGYVINGRGSDSGTNTYVDSVAYYTVKDGEEVEFEDFSFSYRLDGFVMGGNGRLEQLNVEASRDPVMEEEIKNYFRSKYPSIINKWKTQDLEFGVGVTSVYYTTVPVLQMTIKADAMLFGIPAGEPLNDHILIDYEYFDILEHNDHGSGWISRLYDFVFSDGKYIIGGFSKIQTIDEYLSYNPLLNTLLCFRFREKPGELPANIKFVIEIAGKDGSTIRGTTPSVRLK